jgi:hypothetical protein
LGDVDGRGVSDTLRSSPPWCLDDAFGLLGVLPFTASQPLRTQGTVARGDAIDSPQHRLSSVIIATMP